MILCNLEILEKWGWIHNSIVPCQEDAGWLRYSHSFAGTSYLNMSFTTLPVQNWYTPYVAISSPMSGGATLHGTIGSLSSFRGYEGLYTMVNWIP